MSDGKSSTIDLNRLHDVSLLVNSTNPLDKYVPGTVNIIAVGPENGGGPPKPPSTGVLIVLDDCVAEKPNLPTLFPFGNTKLRRILP